MQRTKLLLILAALSFIPSLWFYTVGEEGIYTISSMEMWQSNNWLIQTMYGLNLQRPPLMNWLVIGVSNLIGWPHVVMAIRIVSAAATLGMVSWLYWLCKKLFNDKSFALFTSLACLSLVDLLLYRGWLSYTDPLFSFFTFGAIATLWVAALERNKGWLLASIFLISCALLTKAITAYVFYGTVGLVLLMNRNYRSFLLSPGSLLVLLSILIAPIVWLASIPQLNGESSSLLHEIILKLSVVGGIEYIERFFTYPLDAAWRLGPASLIALYLLLRKRELHSETAIDHYKPAVIIAILTITPYWLAPQGGIRYLMPVYPIVALISARIIWRAGESARHLALNWFTGIIAFKFAFVLVLFPYYQTHVRGENYVIAARHIMQKTAGYPLYVYDFRDVAESIVTQIDIDRLSHSFVKSPPAIWDNGFLLSPDSDKSKGYLVEKIPLGGDQIYLLCRGAACQQAGLSEPATIPPN
jgi:4-amino-4-deoxy-L-arabinose transferase-like glycosyltransferase